jgi:uncharacterized protein YdeI (BOF family)
MKNITTTVAISTFVVFLSSAFSSAKAMPAGMIDQPRPLVMANLQSLSRPSLIAGLGISVHNLDRLPEGRRVRLFGKVEAVNGPRSFTLRDETGTVRVSINSSLPADVEAGREVTVAGRLDHGLMGQRINASSVTVVSPVQTATAPTKKEFPVKTAVHKKSGHMIVVDNTPAVSER